MGQLGGDYLHTYALGTVAFFLSHIVHLCFALDVFETRQGSEEVRIKMSVNRMRAELYDYYNRVNTLRGKDFSLPSHKVPHTKMEGHFWWQKPQPGNF